MTSDRLALTPTEIARSYRISRARLMAWIHSGQLRAVDVGDKRTSFRVEIADLREFLDRRKVKPPPKRRRVRRIEERTKERYF